MVKMKIVQKYMNVETKPNLMKIYNYKWVIFYDSPLCNFPVAVVEMAYMDNRTSTASCTYNIYPTLMIYPGEDIEIPYNSAYYLKHSPVVKNIDITLACPYDHIGALIEERLHKPSSAIYGKTTLTLQECLRFMTEKVNSSRIEICRDHGYANKDYFSLSFLWNALLHSDSLINYVFTSDNDKDPRSFPSYDMICINSKLMDSPMHFKYEDIRDLYKPRTIYKDLTLKSHTGKDMFIDIPVQIV